jgi:hypothetical protein
MQNGKQFETPDGGPIFPSYFNSLFRLFKNGLRPGLFCDAASLLGALTATAATRLTMTAPNAADGEFIYSAGMFLTDVNQAFVDFGVGDAAGPYTLYIDASENTAAPFPRFEIFLRKFQIGGGDGSAANNCLAIGVANWDGTTATIDPVLTAALRKAALGILDLTRLYANPQALRDLDKMTWGDGVRLGGEPAEDPTASVNPEGVNVFLGRLCSLFFGPSGNIKMGAGGQIILSDGNGGSVQVGDALLRIIAGALALDGSPLQLDQTSPIVFGASDAPQHQGDKNVLTVEHIAKVDAYAPYAAWGAPGGVADISGIGVDSIFNSAEGVYVVNFLHAFAVPQTYRLHVDSDYWVAPWYFVASPKAAGSVTLAFYFWDNTTNAYVLRNTSFSIYASGVLA